MSAPVEGTPFAPSPPSTDRVVYTSSLVCIGLFRCAVTERQFEDTGPIRNHVVVFPRRAVGIEPEGRPRVVASPNVVMFYNRGQAYRRRPLDAAGDASDWFAFAPRVLSEVMAEIDPKGALCPDRPFRLTHAPSGAPEYLAQRRLIERLRRGESGDSLATDEACMLLLRRVMAGARRRRGGGRERRAATRRQRDDLVAAACEVLALRFAEGVTLNRVAREVGASPYHLARIFKEGTGSTMHRHLEQLRLRAALEALAETRDIATVGLSLGYSSHSHFTAAFHRAFGVTPSAYRSLGRTERTRIRARS